MANARVISRLDSIRNVLLSAHAGGSGLTSPMIGSERESFINLVLGNVVAPPFRVGTGEITDTQNNSAGQVDIVVEYTNTMSFPLLQGNSARLYLAESVCCVIEVKSNLSAQWDDVVKKAETISALKRDVGVVATNGIEPPDQIPLFAVGFKGWSTDATCADRLEAARAVAPSLAGILVLESGIFVGASPDFNEFSFTGPAAIFGLLLSMQELTSSLMWAKPEFRPYVG